MILIFDYFETLVHNRSTDFNRGLKIIWKQHYADKYSFDEISLYGEEIFKLMPAIPDALSEFEKMGIKMYVLSNSGFSAEALAVPLDKFGIGQYFKKIWSSADFGRIKPDRAFFEMAIQYVLKDNPGESRDRIVFVGDTYESDIVGATNAGLDAIWINNKNAKNAYDFA